MVRRDLHNARSRFGSRAQDNKIDSDGIEEIGVALLNNSGLTELTLLKNRCVVVGPSLRSCARVYCNAGHSILH